MSGRSTVAVAQVAPVFLDLADSLRRAEEAIAEAARAGARLVAFAETWLPGYPSWADVGIPWEGAAAKAAFARLHRNAVEVPGPATEALCRAARRHRVHVVMGMTERDARFSRGTLYNSLLYVSDAGEVLGVHRKLVPTHSERVIWGRGDGSGLHVLETPLGRLGGLICWEHWMPLARFAMHAKGEQIHVAAWPDLPEIHHVASRSYAFEGRCYVLCAGMYLPLDAVPHEVEVREELARVAAENPDPSLVLWGGKVFEAGLVIALPALIALLGINLGMGVVSRAAPQLNLFAVGFPVAMLFGFLVLLLSLPALRGAFLGLLEGAFAVAAGAGGGG